jgi:serine/threonine protein kinase
MIQPKTIGEGSFGCVHKPPLNCKNQRKQENSNKVSKILTKINGQDELNEFFLISEVDKNGEYHLGRPTSCEPAKIDTNMMAIKDCSRLQKNHIHDYRRYIDKRDMDKFMLLIMKDGGYDIEQFSEQFKKQKPNAENMKQVRDFLIEGFRLIEGLVLFLKHGIIHHDLKAQNIVYNPKENRINFIDFGMMNKINNVRREAENSEYGYDVHWSFPFEISLWNKSKFSPFVHYTPQRKQRSIKSMIEKIKNNGSYAFEIIHNEKLDAEEDMRDYMLYLSNLGTDYDKFLNKSINTFDLYGVGLAFMVFYNNTEHIFKALEKEMNLKMDTETSLNFSFHNLFQSMVDPNLNTRSTVHNAHDIYMELLLDSGLLDKNSNPRSKTLQEMLDYRYTMSTESAKVVKEIITLSNSLTPVEKETIKQSTPKVKCKEGKEYNKRTKRCVKKCQDGYRRNEDFKCVKIPKSKTQKKKKSLGACPEDKERNPKTNRCVQKCKPGYKRNDDFKCVKIKNKTR